MPDVSPIRIACEAVQRICELSEGAKLYRSAYAA
jgi:hypothetical protein